MQQQPAEPNAPNPRNYQVRAAGNGQNAAGESAPLAVMQFRWISRRAHSVHIRHATLRPRTRLPTDPRPGRSNGNSPSNGPVVQGSWPYRFPPGCLAVQRKSYSSPRASMPPQCTATSHSSLQFSCIPDDASLRRLHLLLTWLHVLPLRISRPFDLYSSGAGRATSCVLCVTGTCCSRSNIQPLQRSHYVRNLQRREAKRSYGSPVGDRPPPSVTVADQSTRPRPNLLPRSPFSGYRPRPPAWSPPKKRLEGSSFSGASAPRSRTGGATRSKKPIRRETFLSCDRVGGTPPGLNPRLPPYLTSCAGTASKRAFCACRKGLGTPWRPLALPYR